MAVPGNWSDEFLVNLPIAGAQYTPAVAALADGRFAVAYTDYSGATAFGFTDMSYCSVRVQVHNPDGTLAAAPVQVNTVTTFHQQSPSIAATADGGFTVAFSDLSIGWDSGGDDIWGEAVRMQHFTADGVKSGAETRVNTTVYGDQDHPGIVTLLNGRFLVAWDEGYEDADENIAAQLFNPDGSRAGSEFLVNQHTAGGQTGSDLAALSGGGYVVTWTDAGGADGDGSGIGARLFAGDGTPLAGDFIVNATTTGDQFEAQVAALPNGDFVVVWTDNSRGTATGGDDASNYAIRGQVFTAAGVPLGSEFLVNATTTWSQMQPTVLALSDGRFVAAWCDTSGGTETGGDDTSFAAIRARVFNPDGTPASDEFLVNATTAGFQNEPQLAELADGRVVFTWTDYSHGVETGGDDPSNAAIRARILDLRQSGVDWTGTDADEHRAGTIWHDRLSGGGGADYLAGGASCDRIDGGTGSDRLVGGSGWDILHGGDGYDRIDGDDGRDRLYGEAGGDLLSGGTGNDRIRGGGDNDVISGGSGADILTGGSGIDVFVFADASDSTVASSGRDQITDFRLGTDLVDLSDIDADPATYRDDAFTFRGRDPFSGTSGEVRYRKTPDGALLQADLDGDGLADMVIAFNDRLDFGIADFIL